MLLSEDAAHAAGCLKTAIVDVPRLVQRLWTRTTATRSSSRRRVPARTGTCHPNASRSGMPHRRSRLRCCPLRFVPPRHATIDFVLLSNMPAVFSPASMQQGKGQQSVNQGSLSFKALVLTPKSSADSCLPPPAACTLLLAASCLPPLAVCHLLLPAASCCLPPPACCFVPPPPACRLCCLPPPASSRLHLLPLQQR